MVREGSAGSPRLGKTFSPGGEGRYVSISHRVGTSLNFGVRPARTTLSEHAMHSMQSVESKHIP